jgi:hypothetical protein
VATAALVTSVRRAPGVRAARQETIEERIFPA